MRQLSKFESRHQWQKRGFFTETQFLKFAEPRVHPNLTNLVRATPHSSAITTLIEVSETTEETGWQAIAKAASR